MKKLKLLVIVIISIILITLIVSCQEEVNSVVITFNSNGGTEIAALTLASDSVYPASPTREGYTFDGWYTELTGGTKISEASLTDITESHILYAHWLYVCTISFDYQNATGNNTETTKAVTENTVIGALPKPTLSEYCFSGWFTAVTEGEEITSVDVASEDITLYARFNYKYIYTVIEVDETDTVNITGLDANCIDAIIVIPSIIDDKPVYSIDSDAFKDNTYLTDVTIPGSVYSIGTNAFTNCTSLANVTLNSGLYQIGAEIFKNCPLLTSIVLPESLVFMGSNTFENCTGLTTVTLERPIDYRSDGVTPQQILDYTYDWNGTHGAQGMFLGCTSLTTIYAYLWNGDAPVYMDPLPEGVLTGVDVYSEYLIYWMDYADLFLPNPDEEIPA